MAAETMFAHVVWRFGPVTLTDTVLTTWGLVLFLALASVVVTHRLKAGAPGHMQAAVEGMMEAGMSAVRAVAPEHAATLGPFILTLWLFIFVANLVGLVPGLRSPTRDLSLTAALAVLVFLSVHWYGIRILGLRAYLRHYLAPNPVLLPFHLIGEITRTLALAVRLFGNMMSIEMVGMMLLLVAGFLVPVPILMLHIVEAVVQTYIFGMLALVYIASAMQSQAPAKEEQKP